MGITKVQGDSLQRMIAVVGAAAFMVQGYNQSMMNGFTTLPTFLQAIPEVDTVNTTGGEKAYNAKILGLVVAIYEVGSAIGALSCLLVGDRLGRPRTMLLAGCICVVGVVIQATTFSLAQILVGRVITGVGIGLYTGTVPIESGLAVASWVNFGMFHSSGPVTWRFPMALQLVLLIVILSLTPFLPESPRWLVKKERLEEATAIMARLMGRSVDDAEVAREIAGIYAAVQRDAGHRHQYSANPFSMNKNRHLNRLLLAVTSTMITQMTGINVIAFYSVSIFEGTLGYSGSEARVFSACLQVTLALGGLAAIFTVDRFGRRRLMLFSTACMVLAQAAVAGLSSNLSNVAADRAAIFFYFFAMLTLPVGMFIIPFMYGAEIAPLGIRHKVTAMGAATSWLFNFMVAEVTPIAFANIGWRYNIVYSATSAAGCLVIYLFYPETRGRSLEEIDEIFLQSKNAFDPVRVAKTLPMGLDVLDTIEAAGKIEAS
ncbi:general substrate transporter [Aspergillus crustosus]